MSIKEAVTNKRPRVSNMDTGKDATPSSEIAASDGDVIDLGRYSKEEAPSLEAFLLEPTKYRPRQEFLGGVASYIEVRLAVRQIRLHD